MSAAADDYAAGLARLRAGDAAAALGPLQRAHRADPAAPAPLHAVASALQQLGRMDEAVATYRQALAARPGDPVLGTALARALLLAGDRSRARALLEPLVAATPTAPAGAGLLGLLLREDGDADGAVAVLAPAVGALASQARDHPDLLFEYVQALAAADRPGEARDWLARYRALRPGDPRGALASARLHAAAGAQEQARRDLAEVLSREPASAAARWELAQLDGFALSAAARQAAGQQLATAAPPAAVLLHDLLARAADRAGDHGAAVHHAAAANRLRAQQLQGQGVPRYESHRHAAEVRALQVHYTARLLQPLAQGGSQSRWPVFVFGLPRSGTTLLERMLAAHPSVVGVGEQDLARRALVHALQSAGAVAQITPAVLQAAADRHLDALRARAQRLDTRAGQAERIVDKLPDNYLLAGWLALCFPNATLLHCLRDPRDVAVSCWLAQYQQLPWTLDLEDITHRIEQHRLLMAHWRQLLGTRLIEVRHEDLLADPAATLQRILAAMDLPFDAAVLDSRSRGGVVRSASQAQVREPLHTRGMGRWRRYESLLAPVRDRLDRIAEADGYA